MVNPFIQSLVKSLQSIRAFDGELAGYVLSTYLIHKVPTKSSNLRS